MAKVLSERGITVNFFTLLFTLYSFFTLCLLFQPIESANDGQYGVCNGSFAPYGLLKGECGTKFVLDMMKYVTDNDELKVSIP